MMSMAKTVELVSCDGVRFPGVDVGVAAKFRVFKTKLQDIVLQEGKKHVVLVADNVTGVMLELVLDWAKNHPV